VNRINTVSILWDALEVNKDILNISIICLEGTEPNGAFQAAQLSQQSIMMIYIIGTDAALTNFSISSVSTPTSTEAQNATSFPLLKRQKRALPTEQGARVFFPT